MPQELNKIWNAGKYFEPQPEQPEKQPESEPKPSNVKRKKSVIGAFIDKPEDPFKEKVEAVLKGVEHDSVRQLADEEKPVSVNEEVIVGTGQDNIGQGLATGKSIHVKGNAGWWIGNSMTGGKIYVEGNVGMRTGCFMSGGEIYVEGFAGIETGHAMSGGEVYIKSGAGGWAGESMSGGTLRIDGDVTSFDKTAFTSNNKGTIIWKGETIWENGKKVEPGWTNLNVKEKIAE